MHVSREVAKCTQVTWDGNDAHARCIVTEHRYHLSDFIPLWCRLEGAAKLEVLLTVPCALLHSHGLPVMPGLFTKICEYS